MNRVDISKEDHLKLKETGLLGAFVLLTGVTAEDTCRGELTEFMTDHVLRNINGDEFVPVMHSDGKADEIGGDHRSARPRFDRGLFARLLSSDDTLFQFVMYIRSFF